MPNYRVQDDGIIIFDVLDKGHIALQRMMPCEHDVITADQAVAQYARASTYAVPVARDMNLRGEKADVGLVRRLLDDHHDSPLQHIYFTFHIKCPILVARQWRTHVSYKFGPDDEWDINEMSGRYQKYPEEFYVPTEWRGQASWNKQASEGVLAPVRAKYLTRKLQARIDQAVKDYEQALSWGVSREQARLFLQGFALYTEFFATGNARTIFRSFVPKRDHPGAQWEMRPYAHAIREVMELKMPLTAGLVWGGTT